MSVAPRTSRWSSGRDLMREAGELGDFTARSIVATPASLRFASEALLHARTMLAGTLPLLVVMSLFIGFSQVNFAYFFLRSIGASDFIGAVSGFAGPRITATVMLGYVFTAKVCCGIVAEVGAMRVSEEIDALEVEGIDPMRYVVGTRVLAALIFLPIASVITQMACLLGSYTDVVLVIHGISAEAFWSLAWSVSTVQDLVNCFLVHATIVALGTVVAGFYGLRTRGGPDAVGAAVARSLVVNLMMVHLVTAAFGAVFYGTSSELPFGG